MDEYYANFMSYSREVNGERIHTQCDFEHNEAQSLAKVYGFIKDGSLRRLEIEKKNSDLSLSIFMENGRFFIGTVDMYDDEVFYYTNGTDDTNLVEIDGGFYEKRLVCTDIELLCNIIEQFVKDGTRYDKAQWIEDER